MKHGSPALAEAMLGALFRKGDGDLELEVFALLDGAADHRLLDRLRRSGLDSRCLLAGRLPVALARTAPWLVAVGRRSELARDEVAAALAGGRALFLRSTALLQELQRHLRTLLEVLDPAGRPVWLRFYDPRVMLALLPTCSREELPRIFGPVESFEVLPGGDRLRSFSLVGDRLREQVWRASGKVVARVADDLTTGGELWGSWPATSKQAPKRLRLRQPQWDALRGLPRARFVDHAMALARRAWPARSRSLGPEGLRARVESAIETASWWGIVDRQGVLRWLNLGFALGEDFPARPWAARVLARDDLHGATKMEVLASKAARVVAAEAGR